jgi:D-alanyl-D-alanine carboxypeptidase (penicillin-binding protein 5/6)
MRPALLLLLAALALAPAAGAAGGLPPAPTIDAHAWLLENASTGEVLASHDATARVPIASITKLMTVLVVLDRRKLDDVVQVDPRVEAVGQESAGLRGGELLTVRQLLQAALIQSANDAADALALSVAPDFGAFSVLMNAKAHALGLTDSHFVRPDGLDAPGEVSSARDVTRLALRAMRIPAVRDTVRRTDGSLPGGRELHTWNDLLGRFPGVFGVKTGHTNEAGWSQVVADRGHGVTLYATILGSPSRTRRNDDLERLLVWGLAQYERVDAIAPRRVYATVALPYGRRALGLVAAKPLVAPVRVGRSLRERVVAPLAVSLPVRAGQRLGRVQVWDGKRLLGSSPLVASRSVPRPGLAGRLGWYGTRTLHHMAGLFR